MLHNKLVAMLAIERPFYRGRQQRGNLDYISSAVATWTWWCARHGIEFIVIDNVDEAESLASAPPTVLRWFAPRQLIAQRGPETKIAIVDADTMIRWDTPDFFDIAGDFFAAVRAGHPGWIARSIGAFQHLFPGVHIQPHEYVNSGVVVLGLGQLPMLDHFCRFYREHQDELETLFVLNDVGTDQPLLNYALHEHREPVRLLDRRFNFIHCFGYEEAVRREFELGHGPDWQAFPEKAYCNPSAFAFIEAAYIWHFTNVVAARKLVMAETWRRVKHHYV